MIRFEDQCVGCPTEMGCLGSACPHIHVPILICDECHDYADYLYWFEGEQICEECLLKKFEKVDLDEYE